MRDQHQTSIGNLIADLRRRLGWSQRQLAHEVRLDQSAVSRIEAGSRRVSASELQRVADLLNVSADTLLAGDLGCLMNMAGKLSRQGKTIEVRHVAEVLAGMTDTPPIGAPGES